MKESIARETSEVGMHAGLEALSTIVRVCGTLPTVEAKSVAALLALAFLKNVIDDSAMALGPQLRDEINTLSAIFAKAGMGEKLKAKADRGDFDSEPSSH